LSEIKIKVANVHNNLVSIDESTYRSTGAKARFIDVVHGEWITLVSSVIAGHGHPHRGRQRSAQSQRKSLPVIHWKTATTCVTQSSYEYATLMWLNKNQYDFDWQVPITTPFLTPVRKNFAIYYIDLFIKDGPFAKQYVEIKGTWNKKFKSDSINPRQKWEWFHAEHPNSLLWMQSELTSLNILDAKGYPHPDLLH